MKPKENMDREKNRPSFLFIYLFLNRYFHNVIRVLKSLPGFGLWQEAIGIANLIITCFKMNKGYL